MSSRIVGKVVINENGVKAISFEDLVWQSLQVGSEIYADDSLTESASQELFLDWLALKQPNTYESYTWNGWTAALELARAAFIEGLRSAQALSKCTDDRSGCAG